AQILEVVRVGLRQRTRVLLHAQPQLALGLLDRRRRRQIYRHLLWRDPDLLRPRTVVADGRDLHVSPFLGRLVFPERLPHEEQQRRKRVEHTSNMPEIRPGTAADLEAVAAIQSASPEAAQWNVADYLNHEILVAISENSVAGFIVSRHVAA